MIVTILPHSTKATSFENRIAPEFMGEFTFDGLYDFLLDNIVMTDEKTTGHFIIPSEFITSDYVHARNKTTNEVYYQKNGEPFIRRSAENVKTVTMIPVDVDDGMTIEEAQERFDGYSYIIYTSFNHLADGVTHKFRMLFPIVKEVSAKEFQDRRKAIIDFLGPVDRTALYLSHGFYTPTISKENQDNFFMDIVYGNKEIDLFDFEETITPEYVSTDEELDDKDMQEIKDLLSTSSVSSYDEWWQMVQAMKSAGYSESDVIDVSANNPLHESNNTGIKTQSLCSSTYRGLSANGNGMGKITLVIRAGGHPDFRKKGSGLEKRKKALKNVALKLKKQKLKRQLAGK